MNRSTRKDGRKAKGARASRSKSAGFSASVPPSAVNMLAEIRRENAKFERRLEVTGMTVMVDGLARSIWREDFEEIHAALRSAIYFYDRVVGNVKSDQGWTAADVKRMARMRELAGLPPLGSK